MYTAKSYPVFEADQVLTNRHLNDMFNYLEQHDRLTRIKLIGSGIVCGLDVSFQEKDSIEISNGCGLTSQGYLITFCDTVFTYFVPYTTRNFPDDLLFIKQCEDDVSNPKPFYKEEFKDGIFQLITTAQFNNLNADDKLTAIALNNNSSVDLTKYTVVIFLETEEISLKNCDTNDCNDKGSEMDFEVKALLVEKALIDELEKKQQIQIPVGKPTVKPDLHHIELKRYNVPLQDLKSADEVLQAFATLVDDAKLRSISEVLNYCFIHYYYLLEDEPSNPFENVFEQFKTLRDGILKNNPILIQYFYDFIDDVLKAYYEFKRKVFEVSTNCGGDEMNFPLHLMLGEATVNTSMDIKSAYREYFIYSPFFNNQKDKLAEIRLLFTRIKLLITEVDFTSITNFEKRVVKITPSRYGYADLSDRCIPFHYNVTDEGKELYRYWSYDKTRRGNYRFNLGYNANLYCFADNVIHPLLYDIERFDFFRIEGHIGKNITQAITLVKTLQQENNLPFDITALSADYIGALVRGEEPQCVIQDLESNYRMLVAEFLCKVHDAFCLAAKLPYDVQNRIRNFTAATFERVITVEDTTRTKRTIGFNPDISEKINHPFASALVNEFQAVKQYTKGDTLLKLCNPGANTIGSSYIAMKGKVTNPVSINAKLPATSIQFHAFEFVNAIESILELVMNNELADVNTTELKNRSYRLEKENSLLSTFADSLMQLQEKNELSRLAAPASDLNLDLLVFNLERLLNSCFVEQVEAIKSEYNRRMAQYRLAKNFSYYFKNHGGIEHKAGVPRSGTFIMVYHEERKNRLIDRSSLFVNANLSNLMISRFRDLIQPEVPIDTLTYQTKLLQTSILYKDPELYVRFKDVLGKYIDDSKDLPEDKRKDLTDIINREPKRQHFELTDGMVIADFFIPYMCCSDCPPIAYILPEQPKPAEDPTIKIAKNSFCSNNDNRFPITVTPKGGVVTGSGVSVQNDGSFMFVPFTAGAGLHTLTYAANGKTASVQVEIIASPVAKFSYTFILDGNVAMLTLLNETDGRTGTTTYEWLRDGKSFTKEENPAAFKFKTADPVKNITLKVANGDCSSESSQDIEIQAEEPTIKIDKDSFCNNDKTSYAVIVTPEGGNLKGDGITIANGVSFFVPAAVKTAGDVVLTYTVNGKSANTTVQVSVVPVASFSFTTKTEGDKMSVSFKNESTGTSDTTKYNWLNDGKEFSEKGDPEPIVFDIQTLPHIIYLKITNGLCSGEFSQLINLEIENKSLSFCSNIKSFRLEPNLTTSDIVKVLNNDGIKMKDATLEILPSSTEISKTKDFHVSYTINGKQVNVTITIILVNAGFIMNLTRNTSPLAAFPTILSLRAKLDNAEKYAWKITTEKGKVFDFAGQKAQINFSQLGIPAGPLLNISLIVRMTDQSGTVCENSENFALTESIFGKHINRGEFDNLAKA